MQLDCRNIDSIQSNLVIWNCHPRTTAGRSPGSQSDVRCSLPKNTFSDIIATHCLHTVTRSHRFFTCFPILRKISCGTNCFYFVFK